MAKARRTDISSLNKQVIVIPSEDADENEINDELLCENNSKAQELLDNPDKVDRLLKRLERKLMRLPKLGGSLARIPQMAMLINSYIRGDYSDVPVGTIVGALGAVLYFVMPVDLILDVLPGGLVDDAAVAAASLLLIKGDLDEYMAWRVNTGLDEEEAMIETETVME